MTGEQQPACRAAAWMIRGNPTPEEIAALVAVLTAAAVRPPQALSRSWRRWALRDRPRHA